MTICIDSRMIFSSGIGTLLRNIVLLLQSSSYRTTLILNGSALAKREWGAFACKQCDAPIYSVQEQAALPFLIPSCDLFWSPHYNIPLLPIRAKKRVVTIHDACHLALSHLLNWKEKLYAQTMLSQAASRSHLVITDSLFSRAELSKYLSLPEERFEIIYPGVDYDRFSRACTNEEKENLKRKYSLPSSYFLFVSNLKPHKNLRLLLKVYEGRRIDIPLVVIGKRKGLLNIDPSIRNASSIKNVIFTDEVLSEELPIFYQMATALVFPSLYEGFGLPPIEAMAAGCPAIVSRRSSLPEVCGDAAYFFDPENVEDLVDAMIKMASDPTLQSKFRAKGKVQAKKYSWEKTFSQYLQVFQEMGEK